MLTAQDLRGLYAIIPTPAREGADRWDATDTVDLDETARLVQQLLADGAQGLIALGATGECATLTNSEYDAFVDCVLATAGRRVPTFIGTTALGGHEIVRRMRFVRERGADGVLLGLPMWQPCTLEMGVRQYAAMSELFPELAIMVYANTRAFRLDFTPEFWGRLASEAPSVMSAKFSRPNQVMACLATSRGRINFVPNENAALRFAELSEETATACWATAASMGPEPARALMDAILARDWERARQVDADIQWASEPTSALTSDAAAFASYNIQMEKTRINEAGYCKAGPFRPPYDVFPEEHAAGARECGRRWATIRQKYLAARSGAAASVA